MCKKLLVLLVLIVKTATARDKVENWIEVRSPHFVVATTANEKQARRIADQFERMRSLFQALFPQLEIDPSSPIIVIAVKDDKDFRTLEPQEYLAKGSLQLGGLFFSAQPTRTTCSCTSKPRESTHTQRFTTSTRTFSWRKQSGCLCG